MLSFFRNKNAVFLGPKCAHKVVDKNRTPNLMIGAMLKLLLNNNGVKLQAHNFLHHFHPILLYSTTSSPTPTELINPAFATYLVSSLGFSKQQSLSTSTRLSQYSQSHGGIKKVSNFKFAVNADSVIDFFKQHGFDDTHVRKVVTSEPRILAAKVEKTLKPKFKLLQEMGFSGPSIAQLVSKNPSILYTGMTSSIVPTIQVLREIMGSDSDVITIFEKSHWNLFSSIPKHFVGNVALLRSYGIPIELMRKRILWQPCPFFRPTKSFEAIMVRVEEMLGISRSCGLMFLSGIHVLSSLSEKTIESKCDVFRSFGWSESDVGEVMRKYPHCLAYSEDNIRKSLEFFVKELGCEPAWLTARLRLLTLSLEKRLRPRFRVLLVLEEKGLIGMDQPLDKAFMLSESAFLEKFVQPFEVVHELYAKLKGCTVKQLTEEPLK